MNEYNPHRWVIVEMSDDTNTYRKVFSGDYGGYTGSDTWKLSSAIESIEGDGEHFVAKCQSGSTYRLRASAYGMSNYMCGMYEAWITDIENSDSKISIRVEDTYGRS